MRLRAIAQVKEEVAQRPGDTEQLCAAASRRQHACQTSICTLLGGVGVANPTDRADARTPCGKASEVARALSLNAFILSIAAQDIFNGSREIYQVAGPTWSCVTQVEGNDRLGVYDLS